MIAGELTLFGIRKFLPPQPSPVDGSCLPSVGRIVRAVGLSRLQQPWPSHNFRNTSPCLVAWFLPARRGPSMLAPVASLLRRTHYEELCEVLAGRQGRLVPRLRIKPPCRSRASPPAAPAYALRAPARQAAPQASRSFLTPCHMPHATLRVSGQRSAYGVGVRVGASIAAMRLRLYLRTP
jgi:hypothetical protein